MHGCGFKNEYDNRKSSTLNYTFLGSVGTLLSCWNSRAGRDLTKPTGEKSFNRIPFLALLNFQGNHIYLTKIFFLFFYI
jgi:hypothetical protein